MHDYAQRDAAYVAKAIESSLTQGITSASVAARREKTGKNVLVDDRRASFGRFCAFLAGKLSVFLIGAALLLAAFILPLFTVIAVSVAYLAYIVVLFCLFSYREKGYARLAADAFPYIKAVRDGKVMLISPEELVKGDLLKLTAGDVLFANAYIVSDEAVEAVCVRNGRRETLIKRGGASYNTNEPENILLIGDVLRAGECYALVIGLSDHPLENEDGWRSYTERSQSRLCRMSVRLSSALAGVMLIFSFFFLHSAESLVGILLSVAALLALSPAAWCDLLLDAVFLARNAKMRERHHACFSSMQAAEEAAGGNCFLLSTRAIYHSSRYAVKSFESGTGIRVSEMSSQNTPELSTICTLILKIREKNAHAQSEKHLTAFCKRHAEKDSPFTIDGTAFCEESGISVTSVRDAKDGRAFSFVEGSPEALLPYAASVSEQGRVHLLDKKTKESMLAAIAKMKKNGHKLVAYAISQTRVSENAPVLLAADLKLLGFFVLSELPDEKIEQTLKWIAQENKKAFFFHDGDDPSWITDALPMLSDIPVLDANDANIADQLAFYTMHPEMPFAIGLHFTPAMQSKLAHMLADAGYRTVAAGASFADHRLMCASSVAIAPLKSHAEENVGVVRSSAGMYAKQHVASMTACVREAEKLLHSFGVFSAYFCASLLVRSMILLVGIFFGVLLLPPTVVAVLGFVIDFTAFFCLSHVASKPEDAADINTARDRNFGFFLGAFFGSLAIGALALGMTFFSEQFRFDAQEFVFCALLLMLNVGVIVFGSAKVSRYSVLFCALSLLAFAAFLGVRMLLTQNIAFYGELPFWAMIPTVVLIAVGKIANAFLLKNKNNAI